MKISDHMTEEQFTQKVYEKANAMREALVPDKATRAKLTDEGIGAMMADVIAAQAALCAVANSNIKALAQSDLIDRAAAAELAARSERLSMDTLAALRDKLGNDSGIPDNVTCH